MKITKSKNTQRGEVEFFILITFVTLFIGLVFGSMVGKHDGVNQVQKEAVKAGVAHYTANVDGDSIFQFNTNKN